MDDFHGGTRVRFHIEKGGGGGLLLVLALVEGTSYQSLDLGRSKMESAK